MFLSRYHIALHCFPIICILTFNAKAMGLRKSFKHLLKAFIVWHYSRVLSGKKNEKKNIGNSRYTPFFRTLSGLSPIPLSLSGCLLKALTHSSNIYFIALLYNRTIWRTLRAFNRTFVVNLSIFAIILWIKCHFFDSFMRFSIRISVINGFFVRF